MSLSMFLASSRCNGTVCARAENSQCPLKARVLSTSSQVVSPVSCESSCSSLDPWSISEIARELEKESTQFRERFPGTEVDFTISQGSVSKAIAGLEEQLGVRRRGTAIVVPEPARLLQQWAEKYKERYRWRLRSSFQTGNPFGSDLTKIADGISPLLQGVYAFTGAIAATTDAPFIDIDIVDVFAAQRCGGREGSDVI